MYRSKALYHSKGIQGFRVEPCTHVQRDGKRPNYFNLYRVVHNVCPSL